MSAPFRIGRQEEEGATNPSGLCGNRMQEMMAILEHRRNCALEFEYQFEHFLCSILTLCTASLCRLPR